MKTAYKIITMLLFVCSILLALPVAAFAAEPIEGLPDRFEMHVGDEISWNPSPFGGKWEYDKNAFAATFSSVAVFQALEEGTYTITYKSIEGEKKDVVIVVKAKDSSSASSNINSSSSAASSAQSTSSLASSPSSIPIPNPDTGSRSILGLMGALAVLVGIGTVISITLRKK